jgi:hypothetical protein
MEDSSHRKGGAPSWAMEPFKVLLNQTERLHHLLRLSTKGIAMIQGVPRMVEVLNKIEDKPDEDAKQKLAQAKEEAELATREVREGFPLLNAQAAIALWSSLEATVRLFVGRWLRHEKTAMQVDIVQKLRVRLGDYERLDEENRCFFIVDRIETEVSAPLTNGVGRFEALLSPFGLGGSMDEDVKRTLFELSQVRNVLVHRYGVADKRLAEACPWLGVKAGDPVKLDHTHIRRYFEAVTQYALELIIRVGEHFGVDMAEFRKPRGAVEGQI